MLDPLEEMIAATLESEMLARAHAKIEASLRDHCEVFARVLAAAIRAEPSLIESGDYRA